VVNDAGKQLFGQCHFRRRTLLIAAGQPEEELVDTLVHEVLHALLPRANEKNIVATAGDLLCALDRLGLLAKQRKTT
jgi:hypothetical protein